MTITDHSIIIDGFAELINYKNYQPFSSFCGICDDQIIVTSAVQKHLIETKKVPVKMLKRGAIFCTTCKERRARINYLRKGNKFLEEENGRAELIDLEKEEQELKGNSTGLFSSSTWPY